MQPKKFGFCFSFGRKKNSVEGEGGGSSQLEIYISAANNNSSNGEGSRGGGGRGWEGRRLGTQCYISNHSL